MKTSILFVLIVLFLFSLACSAMMGGEPPAETPLPLDDSRATDEPSPTLAPTLTPEPTVEDTSCLQGYWLMTTQDASGKLVILAGDSFKVVDGEIYISFTGSEFAYGSESLTTQFSPPDGSTFEIEGTFLAAGRFSAANGKISFFDTASETTITAVRLHRGGQTMAGPTDGVSDMRMEPPDVAGYECLGDSLIITHDTAGITVVEKYQRQP
jgi:hypothetical protein